MMNRNTEWFNDLNKVYTVQHDESIDWSFSIENEHVSKAMRESVARDIAQRLNTYDSVMTENTRLKLLLEKEQQHSANLSKMLRQHTTG